MIVQFNDIVNQNISGNLNNIVKNSNNRFFHDRNLEIPPDLFRPVLGGQLNGISETYILFFQLNKNTASTLIRLRILNGGILNFTNGVERVNDDEIKIDVFRMAEKPIAICFNCNPIYGSWLLSFGNNPSSLIFDYCPAKFDFFALIRTSRPLDDNTMELPRFTVNPEYGYEVLGQDLRGSVGQPYGRTIRQLHTLEVNFIRVNANIIDDYFKRVSVTEPHFIIAYPEDVANIPPIWATLAKAPTFQKRNENNWYFNTELSWKEAY